MFIFFFLSSIDIFGKSNIKAIKEKSKISSTNYYAKYKIDAEKNDSKGIC